MCSLERTHDYYTPVIVGPIPISTKSEPIVPPGVGVVWNRPKSESDGVGDGVGRSVELPFNFVLLFKPLCL